ncbi:EAL domain-containing protein [Agromyces soli]|uniref:EAL domain-containing protein n=1 Tax=Agromyces soli TaxID=659012 RepID=A0ABY4AWJ4_9MICO|nr:EAL domain-containing protein [Agromyces soli]UOE26767.1 EAL domain-containing protein [Agromyces soli]
MERRASHPIADGSAEELRRAVGRGELVAFFQPEYELATGQPVVVEALCRWLHPVRGLVLPDRFIPVAERTGLIGDLSRAMLEQAGRRVAEWHRHGRHVGLAVNVSPTQLRPDFAATVLEFVRELALPAGTVTAEITETPALTESCEELEALQMLIDGGIGVSVDDFGAGFTSIEALRRMPLTEVKIDRSLMRDHAPEADALARAAVEVAHERGAVVVAEGIETAEDLDRARRWGCDRGQGFYYSPALPAAEAERLLSVA